jgi:hypothetical protein
LDQSDGVEETASSTNACGRPVAADERRSGTTASCPVAESAAATQRHVVGPTSELWTSRNSIDTRLLHVTLSRRYLCE